MTDTIAILTLSVLIGSAPTVAVALWRLRGGPDGVFRRWATPLVLAWISSPIWAGLVLALGVAFGLTGLVVYAVAPAIIVGSTAAWFLRAALPGFTLGFVTWATPVVTAALYISPMQHGGVALVVGAALWNVAGIMLACVYPLRRATRWPGHCRNCGCDLRGADATNCPGCGKLRRRVENPIRRSAACARCGYDLSGVPDDRCPECGTPGSPSGHSEPSEQPPSP